MGTITAINGDRTAVEIFFDRHKIDDEFDEDEPPLSILQKDRAGRSPVRGQRIVERS